MPRVLSRRSLFAALGGSAAAVAVPAVRAAASQPVPGSPFVVHRTPVRIVDTRTDSFPGRKLAAGDDVSFSVAAGTGGDFATSVFVNLTITETEGAGFLAVRGEDLSGEEPPVRHSNINWFEDGVTLANLVLSTVAGENSIAILCGGNGRTHVVLDVLGYVPFQVTPLPPAG